MTTAAINAGFDLDLKGILPRLRVYALSLTRNGERADDLVQQTALKALAGRASFRVGSNFGDVGHHHGDVGVDVVRRALGGLLGLHDVAAVGSHRRDSRRRDRRHLLLALQRRLDERGEFLRLLRIARGLVD